MEGFNTNNDVPYPPNGHSGNIISIKDVIKSNLVESLIPNKQRLSVQFPVRALLVVVMMVVVVVLLVRYGPCYLCIFSGLCSSLHAATQETFLSEPFPRTCRLQTCHC